MEQLTGIGIQGQYPKQTTNRYIITIVVITHEEGLDALMQYNQ